MKSLRLAVFLAVGRLYLKLMKHHSVQLEFLGTGTSQGVPVIGCTCSVCLSKDKRDNRLRSSVIITVNGKKIVIDTGPDFRYQMLRSGNIDAIQRFPQPTAKTFFCTVD